MYLSKVALKQALVAGMIFSAGLVHADPVAAPRTVTTTGKSASAKKKKRLRPKGFTAVDVGAVSLSYFSWGELVTFTQGAVTDHAHASMLGNALTVDWEHYYAPRWGFDLMGSFLYAVADVGGTQSAVNYNLVNQSWMGVSASAHAAVRISKWSIVSLGPLAIYKNLTLPDGPTGATAVGAPKFMYGATVAFKMRLTDLLEIREEIGTLLKNTSTYWSVGLGCMF